MADLSILAGATSQSVLIDAYVLATGAPQTGLVFNSSGLKAYYSFAGANTTAVAITLATLANVTTAWSSGGFIEIDATNMPGLYRLDLPNAVIAAAKGRQVVVTLTGFSGMATRHKFIELTAVDNQDAVRFGMTALPNANAGVSGGLPTIDASLNVSANVMQTGTAQAGGASTITLAAGASATDSLYNGEVVSIMTGTGAGQARTIIGYVGSTKVATTGRAWVTNPDNTSVYKVHGLTVPRVDDNLAVIIQTGTGTGQLDFTSGVVKANLAQILGTALTETAGLLAGGFKKLFNVVAPTGTLLSLPGAVPGATGGLATLNADLKIDALPIARRNTATAGTSTTLTLDAGASAVDSYYVGQGLVWTSGANIGVTRVITGYVGSTKVATFARALPEAADATPTFTVTEFVHLLPGTDGKGLVSADSQDLSAGFSVNTKNWAGGAIPAPNVAGVPLVDVKYSLGTLSAGAAGYFAPDWGQVNAPTTVVGLTGTTISTAQAIASVSGAIGSVTGAVGSVTARVTANTDQLAGQTVTAAAGVTFPTSVASPTNITAGTIATVTTLTNLPAIPANWITAAGITAAALNGKGDWSTYAGGDTSGTTTLLGRLTAGRATNLDVLSLRNGTAQAGAAGSITLDAGASSTDGIYNGLWIAIESGTGAGQARLVTGYTGSTKVATVAQNWTTTPDATSVFGLIVAAKISGVTLADTLTTYTGDTPQSGDGFARIGAAGAGLTALGDTRIAHLDADTSSRMATYTQPAGFLAATFPGGTLANTANITLVATVTNLTNAPTSGDLTATMKASVTTAATAATPTAASVTGNVGGIASGGITAASFAVGAIDASAIATDAIGSAEIAASAVTKIQAGLSTYAGGAVASVTAAVTVSGGTITTLTNLPAITANWLTAVGINAGALNGKGDWPIGKTGYTLTTNVWDEVLASHLTAGSTGFALNAAGAAGDPWSTALPGAYGGGTAGNIIGNRIDQAISTRLAASGYTAPDNAGIAAIEAKTNNLPASPAAVGDIPTAIQIADAFLDRNMATGVDSGSPTDRTPRQALQFIRNKWTLVGADLTVYKEDDTTPSWTAVVGTDPAAEPIISSDPG